MSRFQRAVLSPFAMFLVWSPLSLLLIWAVATRSVAAYFADERPDTAIQLRPTNPRALLNLAEAELKPEQSAQDSSSPADLPSADTAQIRSWSEEALRNDPLNTRAFRILGQLAHKSSQPEQAQRFMLAAGRRSLRESDAVYWVMQKGYQDGDYRTALKYADILLRTRPGAAEHVMPILGKLAENADASGALKRLIEDNPPWRTQFFERLPDVISDARTPLEMLLSLKSTPTPPSTHELRNYLNFLIGHGFYDLAYYTWLQFLPQDQLGKIGLLFNGDFDIEPSGLPFDWTFRQGSGVSIKVSERLDADKNRALSLEFGAGRVDVLDVAQLVILASGEYRFQGKQNVNIASQRGLLWRITCVGQGDPQIGESSVAKGSATAWQDFSFSFTVPANCPAQQIRLVFDARWASEQFVSGAIWYDELRIVRQSDGNPEARMLPETSSQ